MTAPIAQKIEERDRAASLRSQLATARADAMEAAKIAEARSPVTWDEWIEGADNVPLEIAAAIRAMGKGER